MKTNLLKAFAMVAMFLITTWTFGQSLTPTVIASAGDYYTGTTASLSVTIGEPVIDTYTGTSAILNCGFQQGQSAESHLDLTLFLEGLYNGAGGLNKAQDEFGDHWPGIVADHITVKIAKNTPPYSILHTINDVELNTDGSADVTFPSKYCGTNYIAIFHRNSIQTWMASPISLANAITHYDFTTSASKAYGDNQIRFGTDYAIYSGDVNQDDVVDTNDLGDVDNDSNNFVMGYVSTDVNGDGVVDTNDMGIADNNGNNFIMAIVP